jgi:outer membrane protein OmpA-like peptidoglycan-associated protein
MYEARNAVDIARNNKAEQYAAEIFAKAQTALKTAEERLDSRANKKEIISRAREAVQFSEDARFLAAQRQEEAQIAKEREEAAATAKAAAEAKAATDAAEARRKADEESRRQAELAAAREAQMKAEADAAALKAKAEAAEAKAEANAAAAKAAAEQDALRAKEEAAKAEAERARQEAERAEREKQELRAKLLEQFNRILETRDTPRGLVVTMADVLFDTGKYDLRPAAREKLARLSGIVLAHPGLILQVEGHTDSTGSDELNQKLSERRASTTRDYLIKQGLAEGNVTAMGFGKTMPVADNSTADGRQKNRRVEIIVGGEVIGAKIGK